MSFNYPWLLFLLLLFCYSCKKEPIANVENYPNYYFGKYHPSCGIVPPCSDRFWLINKEEVVQIGDKAANAFKFDR